MAVMALAAAPSALEGQSGDLKLFLPPARIGVPVVERDLVVSARDRAERGREPSIMFEADIFLPITVYRGFDWASLTDGKWAVNAYITPRNVLRVLDDFSGPLRSPSFMPRIDVQLLRAWESEPGRRYRVAGLTLTHAHHSNGGPDCLFLEEGPVDDPAADFGQRCVFPEGATLADVTVNSGGSFSTNFWRVSPNVAFLGLEDSVDQRVDWLVSLAPYYEVHPLGMRFLYFAGGATSRNQRSLFGPQRLGVVVDGEYRMRGGRWVVRADYMRLLEPRSEAYNPEWSGETIMLEFAYRLDRSFLKGWGLGVRYYEGQDYYNLSMVKDIRRLDLVLQIGRGARAY